MDCRLRRNPKRIFECFLEVARNQSDDKKNHQVVLTYPPNYDDQEILRSVPPFCFPCKTERNAGHVQHFTFTLTDGEGKYRFGFCRFPSNADVCLCIISYLPWFDNFYKILNFIGDYYWKGQVQLALDFINIIYETPVPATSIRNITFAPNDGSSPKLALEIPDPYALHSIPRHRNLTDFVCAVQPANILHLFAWQHIFIPVLPPHLIDYCCAPMPFLIGVHSSLMEDVRRRPLSEVVILNVDENKLELPDKDLNALPQELVHHLKSILKRSDAMVEDTIPRAFLDVFALLLGSYKDAIMIDEEKNIYEFNREFFLHGLNQSLKPFMDKVTQLQQFQQESILLQFIAERLEIYNNESRTVIDDFFDTYVKSSTKLNLTMAAIKASSQNVIKAAGTFSTAFIKKFSRTSPIETSAPRDRNLKKLDSRGARPVIELLSSDVDRIPEYKFGTTDINASRETMKSTTSVDKLIDLDDNNQADQVTTSGALRPPPNTTDNENLIAEFDEYVVIDSPSALQKNYNRSVPNFMELRYGSSALADRQDVDSINIAEMASEAAHSRRQRDSHKERISVKIYEPGSIATSKELHPLPLRNPPPIPSKKPPVTAQNSISVRPRPKASTARQQYISYDDTRRNTTALDDLDSRIVKRRQITSLPAASDIPAPLHMMSALPFGVNANPAAIYKRASMATTPASSVLKPTIANNTTATPGISEFDPLKS
ncbi:DENN domain-containing protein 1B [Trichoplax sp. H2]|nr:DENN domain-containing protein 1B [Trichoplax sp. H2]|eukprot:RDD39900.1 DENN domain-containing protein 1B [Trichoplax sp. H2]